MATTFVIEIVEQNMNLLRFTKTFPTCLNYQVGQEISVIDGKDFSEVFSSRRFFWLKVLSCEIILNKKNTDKQGNPLHLIYLESLCCKDFSWFKIEHLTEWLIKDGWMAEDFQNYYAL